jgi:flagellin-like protein
MKMFTTDEEAVSPVIGVILMVAIVVILAAVIAAFVFGMAGSTGTSKNVGMTVTLNNTVDTGGNYGIDILWQGGSDINSLSSIKVTGVGDETTISTTFGVGMVTTIKQNTAVTGRVIIVGTFTDGSTQVLFDRRY